ncbi:MAG: EVE domain-containing protein [Bdellovibrionaceae bacterium]|nr:EVE domain-containing protein [Pseudobdellovibrionaceae bacterium]MDW8189505.1 EVE domain-containing protein [Pseudobdellovibrionaceae bacterium]
MTRIPTPSSKSSKTKLPHPTQLPPPIPQARAIWLLKSEPEEFSIDDWERQVTTLWTGVRNYQARNFMRDQMKRDDLVLFYHSNAKPPCLMGWGRVTQLNQVDPTQFDRTSPYFDPKSRLENPTWVCVAVTFGGRLPRPLSLPFLRQQKSLSDMLLFKKGQRLSIQPVTAKQWQTIWQLAHS